MPTATATKTKVKAKIKERVKLGYEFDHTNEASVEWAKTRAGNMVSEITQTTRKMIRETITGLLEGETSWEDAHEELEAVFLDAARVKTIAHTEVMAAANQGQMQAWDQAVKDGWLDGDEKMVWIVTPDDKLCEICEEFEDMQVPLGEQFPEGGPPAHPNCRCTIGLVP
jgi:hypothetical protein